MRELDIHINQKSILCNHTTEAVTTMKRGQGLQKGTPVISNFGHNTIIEISR